MGKKRILVLASTFPRWKNDSTPPFVFELEKRLARDFDIHVLAPHFPGAKKYELMAGLKVHRFQYCWPARWQKLCYQGGILPNLKKNKLLYLQAFCLIFFELINAIKIARKEKIDFLHAHWIIPQGIVALLVEKILRIPYIVTAHGSDLHSLNLILFKKMVLQNAKKITVVSSYLANKIGKINLSFLKKTEIISMGVDLKLFNPKKYNSSFKKKYNINGPFLLYVGRLTPEKGVEYLIQAMPSVLKKFPQTKLMIIGGGMLKNRLKKQIEKLAIEPNVIFMGSINHNKLGPYFATADIFVSPSIKEGFGLTILEAAISGCQIIGTNIGGVKDIIGKNCLIKPKSPKAISEKIVQLIKSKKPLKRANMDKFEWGNISKQYYNLFRWL